MGLYDDIPWYSTPRKNEGDVAITYDGETFRGRTRAEAERKCSAYQKDKQICTLISGGYSVAEADGQILQLVEFEQNAHIITNDRYRDYAEMHPWLNDMGSENRVHGINVVPMDHGKFRILIAGFNLDITVQQ